MDSSILDTLKSVSIQEPDQRTLYYFKSTGFLGGSLSKEEYALTKTKGKYADPAFLLAILAGKSDLFGMIFGYPRTFFLLDSEISAFNIPNGNYAEDYDKVVVGGEKYFLVFRCDRLPDKRRATIKVYKMADFGDDLNKLIGEVKTKFDFKSDEKPEEFPVDAYHKMYAYVSFEVVNRCTSSGIINEQVINDITPYIFEKITNLGFDPFIKPKEIQGPALAGKITDERLSEAYRLMKQQPT